MKKLQKRHWIILAACAYIFLCVLPLLFFFLYWSPQNTDNASSEYVPGQLPEGVDFAEIYSGEEFTAQEVYDGYSHDADPVHPVLDVKTSLQISNFGSRPGTPRPQDIASEYSHILNPYMPELTPTATPTPAPSVTLTPEIILPNFDPDIDFPEIDLPELYIVNPDVKSPAFTGDSYHLTWEYTGGRNLEYDVLISVDSGTSFITLAENLAVKEYELVFPNQPSENCLLRVSGKIGDSEYLTADSNDFTLVTAPEPAPEIVTDYIDLQIQYVNTPGLRISSLSGLPIWFNAENLAEESEKMIWQLSRNPFLGTEEIFGQEEGILASGEIDKAGGEFSLDMKTLCEEMAKTDTERDPSVSFYPESSVYGFYLRVVALDGGGNCIGDPGRGLYFTYGIPDFIFDATDMFIAEDPQIQVQVYVPYYWEYHWERISPSVLNRNLESDSDYLLFAGMDGPYEGDSYASVVDSIEDATMGGEDIEIEQKGIGSKIISQAVQVEIQVSTSPFTTADATLSAKPSGLVYSYLDIAPDIGESETLGYTYYSTASHGIEYEQFAPPEEELEAMGGIYYYVRAIFYVPDNDNLSALHPYSSETLTVAYRVTSASQNEVKEITVKSYIPYVQFIQYVPVQWQQANYDEYYEVARHIEAEEMQFSIEHDGEFLLPYEMHIAKYHWTREQYQALLDKMLPPGAVIHYVKAEPGFWDEFFDLLSAIYSGASGAYADAKSSVVSLIDYIPLIGDDAKAYLKQAATYAIDYGLASIGLPPSLPNLDQLTEGGIEYITKVAVEEALEAAGVPADSIAAEEITEKVRQEVADGITSELEKAILAQRQNPLNASFLRLDTSKLYEPAYIDVFVCNYSQTYTTRSGELGFSSGNSFDVYKSAVVDIPALKPGEHVLIRVYLDHYRNKYDGYNQYFDKKYNGNSELPYKMHVGAYFPLPDVNIAAMEQGLSAAPLPYVTEFTYDHPAYSYQYEREFVPADAIYESDSTPNTQDFLD